MKRVYEEPAETDGRRFLVDRVWPRGMSLEKVAVEAWLKDVAPSSGLRRWFGHDPAKWEAFQERYANELDERPQSWAPLADAARKGDVTLVYVARAERHNNAAALKGYLERKIGPG